MNSSSIEKGSVTEEKDRQANDTLKGFLEEIDDQVQWFCNEYVNYPTRKKEQKQYRDGLSSIASEFEDEIVVWAKRAGKLHKIEQAPLLDLLAKLGNSFRSISLALCPQIRVATVQSILEDIKSYSEKSRDRCAVKDSTVLYLKKHCTLPDHQRDTDGAPPAGVGGSFSYSDLAARVRDRIWRVTLTSDFAETVKNQ